MIVEEAFQRYNSAANIDELEAREYLKGIFATVVEVGAEFGLEEEQACSRAMDQWLQLVDGAEQEYHEQQQRLIQKEKVKSGRKSVPHNTRRRKDEEFLRKAKGRHGVGIGG